MQNKKKFLFILGTRPEIIKMYPLIHEFKKNKNFNFKILFTNQHFDKDMKKVFLESFSLRIDYELKLFKKNLGSRFGYYVKEISNVIKLYKPDAAILLGDTLSAAAGSISASIQKTKIIYLESGLRTGDHNLPWPEEIFRKMITQVSDFHFAPTQFNKKNLISEGIKSKNIFVKGNTVIDAIKDMIKSNKKKFSKKNIYKKLGLSMNSNYVVITIHRTENIGKNLNKIIKNIDLLVRLYPKINFIFSLHPNKAFKLPLKNNFKNYNNVKLFNPFNYVEFIFICKYSNLILSDSGGIQEEASVIQKRVLVLRDKTERPEGLNKFLYLCGTSKNKTIYNFKKFIFNSKVIDTKNIFGKGNSRRIIYQVIKKIQNKI